MDAADRAPNDRVTSRPPLRGCLLDVDGTLIDSNDAHARSWVDVLTEYEFDVTYAQVRALIGMGGDKLVRAVTGARCRARARKGALVAPHRAIPPRLPSVVMRHLGRA